MLAVIVARAAHRWPGCLPGSLAPSRDRGKVFREPGLAGAQQNVRSPLAPGPTNSPWSSMPPIGCRGDDLAGVIDRPRILYVPAGRGVNHAIKVSRHAIVVDKGTKKQSRGRSVRRARLSVDSHDLPFVVDAKGHG